MDDGGCPCGQEVHDSPEEDVDAKVMGFIRSVRGLNAFSASDLDNLLYDWRFDLLPPLHDDGASGKGLHLPRFSDLPSQQEMHDLLLGGAVPNMHQCIAHALYPDAVPWPREGAVEPAAPVDPCEEPQEGRAAPGGSRPSRSVAPAAGPAAGAVALAARAEASTCPEVTVRGQKVLSTVLHGTRPAAREAPERDPFVGYLSEHDASGLRAARDRRKELDKAVKLEQYQERRLAEQIRDLELIRGLEGQHQAGIHRREERRLAHNEELKRKFDEEIARKLEEEKAARQAEKEEREKEAKREARVRELRARQKEDVAQWQASRSESPRNRRARSEQATARDATRPLAERRKTPRVREVEEACRSARLAAEERPPLPPPPKKHDLPSPRARFEESDAPPFLLSQGWRNQARAVSGMFGLTARERGAVARHCAPVAGLGRMGQYMTGDRPAPGGSPLAASMETTQRAT